MTFLLYVEFDATTESTATMILQSLARMAELVHRDHPGVYTYAFRHSDESRTKLIFTEIYADEQVFLDHGRDPEFAQLLLAAFDKTTGKSRKELCIRNDLDPPLSAITASILDNYLHVTYVPVQRGFFHRDSPVTKQVEVLLVGSGCDESVFEQLNDVVGCVTCLTFEESDGIRRLIAVITNISGEKRPLTERKPSMDTVEIVCSNDETVGKFKDLLNEYFQIRSIHVETSFSGYVRHQSLT